MKRFCLAAKTVFHEIAVKIRWTSSENPQKSIIENDKKENDDNSKLHFPVAAFNVTMTLLLEGRNV